MAHDVSEAVLAVATMLLVEDGTLALDDDVNKLLPFPVRNPAHPKDAVTLRMLLTQSSGLKEPDDDYKIEPSDTKTPLATWLKPYVADGDNWDDAVPGKGDNDSSAGVSLVGLVVETKSGMSLQDFCAKRIFATLGMKEASWRVAGLDPSHLAMPYDRKAGADAPLGHFGVRYYPAGQLRVSASELAIFLAMLANKGEYQGTRVLKAASVEEIARLQVKPNYGLLLETYTTSGVDTWGKRGIDEGGSTDLWFDPTTGAGYLLLTNSNAFYGDSSEKTRTKPLDKLGAKLVVLAEKLP
jgi:CubicO group peptidase (beta-lactamase class C family)